MLFIYPSQELIELLTNSYNILIALLLITLIVLGVSYLCRSKKCNLPKYNYIPKEPVHSSKILKGKLELISITNQKKKDKIKGFAYKFKGIPSNQSYFIILSNTQIDLELNTIYRILIEHDSTVYRIEKLIPGLINESQTL